MKLMKALILLALVQLFHGEYLYSNSVSDKFLKNGGGCHLVLNGMEFLGIKLY